MIEKYWTEDRDRLLKQVYSKAESLKDIVKEYFPEKSVPSVKWRACKLKLKRPKNVPNRYIKKGTLKPLLLEIPEAYYWMGFIFADGHISEKYRLSVIISDKDAIHLTKLAAFLKTKINIYTRKAGSGYAQYETKRARLQIMDVQSAKRIINQFDVHPRKTYNPPHVDILKSWTDDQFLAWLAGFIDGDGSISYDTRYPTPILKIINHASWIDIHRYIQDFCVNYFNIDLANPRINKRGFTDWQVSNQKFLYQLKQEMVRLNLPLMERKWDIIPNELRTPFKRWDNN